MREIWVRWGPPLVHFPHGYCAFETEKYQLFFFLPEGIHVLRKKILRPIREEKRSYPADAIGMGPIPGQLPILG